MTTQNKTKESNDAIQNMINESLLGPTLAKVADETVDSTASTAPSAFDAMSASAKITALYVTTFQRAADEGGLQYWTQALERGASYEEIAEYFTQSPAFDANFADVDTKDFVSSMYLNAFGAEGDAEGITFWTEKIESGEVSKGAFIAELAKAGLNITDDPSNPMNDMMLERQETLNNKIEAALYFTKEMGALSDMGADTDTSSVDVVNDPAYVASVEAIKGVTSDPDTVTESHVWVDNFVNPVEPNPTQDNFDALPNDVKVASLITAMFDRAPDSEELEYWSDQLENGVSFQEMAEAFTQNPVYLIDFNGMTDKAFVQEIYINLFNQASDAETTAKWVNALEEGLSRSEFIADFVTALLGASEDIEGAQNDLNLSRQDTLLNKIDVGLHYAEKTDASMTKDAKTHLANNKGEPAYQASVAAIENVTSDPSSVTDAKADIDFTGAPLTDAIDLYNEAVAKVDGAAQSMNDAVKASPFDADYSADAAGVAAARTDAQAAYDAAEEAAETDALEGIDEAPIASAFSDYIGKDKEITAENLDVVQAQVQKAINSEKTLFDAEGNELIDNGTITLGDENEVLNLNRLEKSVLNSNDLTIDFGEDGGKDTVILPSLKNLENGKTVTIQNMMLGKGAQADTLVASNLAQQFSSISISYDGDDEDVDTDTALTFTLENAKGGKLVLENIASMEDFLALYMPKGVESVEITDANIVSLIKALNGKLGIGETVSITVDGEDQDIEVSKLKVGAISDILGENLQSSADTEGLEQVDFTLSELQKNLEAVRADGSQADFDALEQAAELAFTTAGEAVSGAGDDNIATQIESIHEALSALQSIQEELVEAQGKLDADNKAIDALVDALDYKAAAEKWFDDNGYKSPVELTKNLTATDGDDIVLYEGEDSNGFSITGFGEEGSDSIYFGEEKSYTLVEIEEGQSITGNLGDASAFEIFWQQNGDNVELYVENTTFAGSDNNMNNLSHVTLVGVSGDSLNGGDLDNGFLNVDLIG